MKSKLLPFGLIFFILGFTGVILASGWMDNGKNSGSSQDRIASKKAAEYLMKIRSNQHTGTIDPNDVLQARKQALTNQYKSGNELGLSWQEMGPDNAPGRTRAVIYDHRDETGKTLYTAGVTGGVWKTTNLGATWNKINQGSEYKNLYVSCMEQTSSGTIYAGTGEMFCTDEETYYGGLVGQGLFKSDDGETFTLVPNTEPEITAMPDTVDWAYINEIAVDPTSDRVYVATNTGLWYSNDGNNDWQRVTQFYHDSVVYDVTLVIDSTVNCDSYEVVGNTIIMQNPQLNEAEVDTTTYDRIMGVPVRTIMEFEKPSCSDVEVAPDGTVAATFDNMVFIAPGGNDLIFTNKSGSPENPHLISMDERMYTTTLIAIDTNENSASRTVNFEITTDWEPDTYHVPSPLAQNPGRTQIAFAPSDETGSIMYVTATQQYGYLDNIYLSEDKGETWKIIFPGGTSLEIFSGSGCFNNVLEVFPNDPYKILVGGFEMWMGSGSEGQTGFYDWGAGPVSQGFFSGEPTYLPYSHHDYFFMPGSSGTLAIATNNGIFVGTTVPNGFEYTPINKKLSITQSYTVGLSGFKHYFLTGTQGSGTVFVDGEGNTPETGQGIDFASGGSCAISLINPNAFIYSNSTGAITRSEDQGFSTSFNFNPPASTLFLTPIKLWEDFNSENSRDSVTFKAQKNHYQGETLLVRSANKGTDLGAGYPFTYVLQQDSLVAGDSIRVKDIVQSKLFVAIEGEVWMTKDAVKFAKEPDWWQIAAISGIPTCMDYSSDANYLFVGTDEGMLYRIANIALAYNQERASIESEYCIIATDQIAPAEFEGRFITSVAVDQTDPSHIVVTFGNYGNEDYVYTTFNAQDTATAINFADITGNLPKMPVYSSLIEMNNSNIVILGTELGIYTTQNLEGDVVWTLESGEIGKIPVSEIQQQRVYKAGMIITPDDPNSSPVVYPSIENYGNIYIATYGRGVWRNETFYQPVSIEEQITQNTESKSEPMVYPNPVLNNAKLTFKLNSHSAVKVKVYNLNGMLVKQINQQLPKGEQQITFPCNDLGSGAYIIQVHAGNQVFKSKFIVK